MKDKTIIEFLDLDKILKYVDDQIKLIDNLFWDIP